MTSVPNPSFEAGQRALQQGNYSVAIAYFQEVCETELDETQVWQATQELVTVYRHLGEVPKAIALCQSLTQHPNPNIREWTASTLAELAPVESFQRKDSNPSAHPPPSIPPNSTGFVPLGPPPPPQERPLQRNPYRPKEGLTNSPKSELSNSIPENGETQGASNVSLGKQTSPQNPPQQPENLETQGASNVSVGKQTSSPNPPQQPENSSPPPTPHPSLFTPHPKWRNSGRAKNWNPLKPPKLIRLWLGEIATAIAFFWVLHFLVQFSMQTTNTILVQLPLLQPIPLFYYDPTPAICAVLAILLILSPWLIDQVLQRFHGMVFCPLTQLAARSPEAAQMLQRLCRQRRLPVPKLAILPTKAPVALTYGNLPRTARIVVSQGLLEQLTDEEVTTLYAAQLGHIIYRDFVLMSLAVLIIQLPYLIYWQVAQLGEELPNLIERKLPSYRRFLPGILQGITGVVAALSYGSYWLLRLTLLWFSRNRVYYSDRISLDTTGNPNAMTRAILKVALGISTEIQTTRATSGLLESFDLFLPVGYRQAITWGSCSPQTPFETLLHWDCTNPYRNWLIFNTSHPLLGERLAMLTRCAQFWKLDTELDLPSVTPPIRDNLARLSQLSNSYQALPLLPTALLYGLVLGTTFRATLWLIGQMGDYLDIWQVIWMHNARRPFLNACILIAFSLSLVTLINRYFPDIKQPTVRTEPNLAELFANPTSLPPDSLPVQLTGQLLGRKGLFNWLGQDLILHTSTGLVKLYFWSYLGPLGNLLPHTPRPSDLVQQQVTVTGWFRRGVTPWIDIETLRSQSGRVARAKYPIWITILAVVAALWGAYIIWQA